MKNIKFYMLLAAAMFMVAACGSDDDEQQGGGNSQRVLNVNKNYDGKQPEVARLECPRLKGGKSIDIISIDRLEELTDIDFFCNLPDDIENKVEAQAYTASWMW